RRRIGADPEPIAGLRDEDAIDRPATDDVGQNAVIQVLPAGTERQFVDFAEDECLSVVARRRTVVEALRRPITGDLLVIQSARPGICRLEKESAVETALRQNLERVVV